MKNKTLALAVIMFTAGIFSVSLSNAKSVVKEKNTTIQTTTAQNDWANYKKEQEDKIRKNDERIAELKREKANTSKTVDSLYNKRIATLQQKNSELRTKIVTYKYEESKWEQFKREFNHDMDELGKSLKDLGKDNVK